MQPAAIRVYIHFVSINIFRTRGPFLSLPDLTWVVEVPFNVFLADIVQHRTEHADELRVEFDLWTEGTITAMVRATVQGSLLPQVPVELVLTVRSIRAHARLVRSFARLCCASCVKLSLTFRLYLQAETQRSIYRFPLRLGLICAWRPARCA